MKNDTCQVFETTTNANPNTAPMLYRNLHKGLSLAGRERLPLFVLYRDCIVVVVVRDKALQLKLFRIAYPPISSCISIRSSIRAWRLGITLAILAPRMHCIEVYQHVDDCSGQPSFRVACVSDGVFLQLTKEQQEC